MPELSMGEESPWKDMFPGHACELPPPAGRTIPPLPPDAMLIQRFKHVMLPHVIPWRKHRRFRMLRRSNYAREFEQAQHARAVSWWVIHPYSRFRLGWQAFMMVVILSSLLVKTFTLSFVNVTSSAGVECERTAGAQIATASTISMDALFGLNILAKFNTGYVLRQSNKVVMSRRMIAKRYFKSWFVPDLLSVLPILKFFLFEVEHGFIMYEYFATGTYKPLPIFIHVLIIFTFLRMFELMEHVQDWSLHLGIPQYKFRLIRLIIIYITFFHCMSCAHFSVPLLVNGLYTLDRRSYTWISIVNETNSICDHHMMHYLLSLQRSISFRSGFGFLTPRDWEDTILFLINAWVGAALLAYTLALCLNVLQVQAESEILYERTLKEVKVYMRAKKMPLEMQKRIMYYYSYRLQKSFFDEKTILTSLPPALRNDIKLHCCRRLVTQAPIFKNIPKSLLLAIIRELREEMYLRDDVVYSVGCPGRSMFFVSSGTLMVVLPTGEEIGHLTEGCHFGEMEMMRSRLRRLTSVVALETCELYRLDRSVYRRLVAPIPRLHARIRAHAITRTEALQTLTMENREYQRPQEDEEGGELSSKESDQQSEVL